MLKSVDFDKEFKTLTISAREITSRGLELEAHISPNAINHLLKEPNRFSSWQAQGFGDFSIKLERELSDFYLANIKGNVELYFPCANCLEDVSYNIFFDLFMRLMPTVEQNFDMPVGEARFGDDDLDEKGVVVGYFHNNIIDLGIILRDQIFLLLPDYPMCGDQNSNSQAHCQNDLIRATEKMVLVKENPFIQHFKKLSF